MDKKSKLLIAVVVILIMISILITFWRIMIQRDYIIENQIDCDPYAEKCFIWECDPASTVEGEACTGDPEMDIWYYAVAQRKAANIPFCNPEEDENCAPFECLEGEKDCSVNFCDETTKEEQGVECSDPVQYSLDNPEEEEECAEDDEECLAAEEESECAEDDEECLAAEEESECAEDDEECLAAEEEESECAEGDDECLAAEEEDAECAEGDAECLAAEEEAAATEEESAECDPATEDCSAETAADPAE